jgi:hypothetical protein
MLRLAAIIGGVLLMAGVAYAGTQTLLEQTNGPTVGSTVQLPATNTAPRQELGIRGNEPGEDLRGPCDEAEHANDPRCTGANVAPQADDDVADDHGGNSGPSDRSGRGGDDDGGHSGHGGGGDD